MGGLEAIFLSLHIEFGYYRLALKSSLEQALCTQFNKYLLGTDYVQGGSVLGTEDRGVNKTGKTSVLMNCVLVGVRLITQK